MKKIIFIIALGVTVISCNNTGTKDKGAEKENVGTNAAVTSSPTDLYEKEWKLLELNGKTITLDTTFPKKPYILFDKEGSVSGTLGCNGFGGKVAFEAGNEIKMSQIVSTEMACPNLKVEQDFLDVLNNAKAFTVENNILSLSNGKKEITAKLEATPR